MMQVPPSVRIALAALALPLLVAGTPRLPLFDAIAPGEWRLRENGRSGGEDRAICISDPGQLVQVRHRRASCGRFVVEQGPRSATIHYTCPGRGHGRTTITLQDETLVRIETQGIAGGAPFNADYEARRTGACARPLG